MPKNYRNKNQRNKGGRTTTNKKPIKDTNVDRDIHNSSANDASWYAENSMLLRDSSNLPYGYALGAGFDLTGDPNSDLMSVPGIMTLKVHPSIGVSKDNYSAVNIAARNIYSYVRHANSGSSRYDAPDLMMYILGMDSVYSFFSHMKRIYGVARLYTQVNRYYPRALLSGMGVDPDDVMSNLANLRYYINQLAVKIGSMCIPKSMSIFERHMWLYEGLYVDSSSAKAQTYMFVPDGFYTFDEFSGPGQLVYRPYQYTGSGYTVQQLYQYVSDMLDLVLASEDMQIMSGDILKAYGPEGVFKVAGVSEDYLVLPQYNEEVLSQIQNATAIGLVTNDNITQSAENGAILFDPKGGITTSEPGYVAVMNAYKHSKLLNMYKDTVEPSDSMVATRLMAIASTVTRDTSSSPAKINVNFSHLGSEFITTAQYAEFVPTAHGWDFGWFSFEYVMRLVRNNSVTGPDTTFIQGTTAILRVMQDVADFNYHPAFIVAKVVDPGDGADASITYTRPVMDLNNYTLIDAPTLARMHETALLSEFSCPQMGAFSNKLA